MTVADCLVEYKSLGAEIFGKPRKIHQMSVFVTKRTKYDARRLHNVVADVVARRKEAGDAQLATDRLPFRQLMCQT